MLVPAVSLSLSHASFQAELEGAILQQTASVDFYLQTTAPKWSPDSYDPGGCTARLRSLFLSDLCSSSWQQPESPVVAGAHGMPSLVQPVGTAPAWVQHSRKRRPRSQPVLADAAGEQLEQFLQDDLQRFMQLREQLDQHASASDAAVLATSTAEHQRRLSNCSSSGISFVRLPDLNPEDTAEVEGGDHHPVAAAVAAATAAAVINNLAASPGSAAAAIQTAVSLSRAAPADAAAATTTAAPKASDTHLHPEAEASSSGSSKHGSVGQGSAAQVPTPTPVGGAVPQFYMQPDEEIVAQKRAARARLAELEQGCSTEEQPGTTKVAAAGSGKGWQEWLPDAPDTAGVSAGGSMHSSKVPERPRGLAPRPHAVVLGPPKPLLQRVASKVYELSFASQEGMLPQHHQFMQQLLAGLVLCLVLLPLLWFLQAGGGSGAGMARNLLPAALVVKAEQLCNGLYVCSAVAMLLYCLGRSLMMRPPLLHFREPALERQYLLWSNSGRLFQDCIFQLTFFAVGSCLWLRLLQGGAAPGDEAVAAAVSSGRLVLSALSLLGSGLPVTMLVLLSSPRYIKWRELLLAGSRLCSVLALCVMQLSSGAGGALQLNMPVIALAQVMGIACMQVRLSSFVPSQVLHLLVLLLCTQVVNPLLQFTQLFGGWLCLPCLVLYSMEMHSRKAFLGTLAPAGPLGPRTDKAPA